MQVQKRRLQRGWSQQQLAELSGLSVRTIQRIENGQTPSMESLKSLASVFETDFSTLSSEMTMPTSDAIDPDEHLALERVRKIKGFYVHLFNYVIVMLALLVINLMTSIHTLWVVWPALGWGLGVLLHAAKVFELMPFPGATWERKQVEKRLGRPL
jgi:transcriptional regulator with XRE-family HTH domain